jgi:transcriptional regulator with XRE-family HTH domain
MNIIPLLKKRNMTQRELAQKLGKDPAYVNRMLRTDYDPRFSTVMAVADALECTTDTISKEINKDDDEENKSSGNS